jgi:hypothetical protein
MALGRQIIDFVRAAQADHTLQTGGITKISIVKLKNLSISDSVAPAGFNVATVEVRSAPYYTVNVIALIQQKLSKIRPVLAIDTGDEGDFPGRIHETPF